MSKETAIKTLKWTYKVVRSILFTTIIAVVAIFALIYTSLAIPPVQNYIKRQVEEELCGFFNSKVEIGHLNIRPMNEIIIEDALIYDQNKKECIKIGELGAGINIWRLIFSQKIEVTYVELLNFKADIYQLAENDPLNIEFIIKAFEPKDKNKPPTKFDLKIHNIVIRNGDVAFSRLWKERKRDGTFDPNYITVNNLSGDITIPKLSNDYSEIDLRRLSFNEKSGLQVKELSGFCKIKKNSIDISNLVVQLPESEIKTARLILPKVLFKNNDEINKYQVNLTLNDCKITPSNFACFYPSLRVLDTQFPIKLDISGNKQFLSVHNLALDASQLGLKLNFSGLITDYMDLEKINTDINKLHFSATPTATNLLAKIIPSIKNNKDVKSIIEKLGNINLDLSGKYLSGKHYIDGKAVLNTDLGVLSADAHGSLVKHIIKGRLTLNIPQFDFGNIITNSPVKTATNIDLDVSGKVNLKNIKTSSGNAKISVGKLDILDRSISGLSGTVSKAGNDYRASLSVNDINLNGQLEASLLLNGEKTKWDLEAVINDFDTYSSFLSDTPDSGFDLSGKISAHGAGNSIDNAVGYVRLSDFSYTNWNGKHFNLSDLTISIEELEDKQRELTVSSEFLGLRLTGQYRLSKIPDMVKETLWKICPALFKATTPAENCGNGNFELSLVDIRPLADFFDLPDLPINELDLWGNFDGETNHIELATEIPYIEQGNKLITDTYLNLEIKGQDGRLELNTGTVIPTKKGLLKMDLDILGNNGVYNIDLEFNRGRNVAFYGDVALTLGIDKNPVNDQIELTAFFEPTLLHLFDAVWNVEESEISYMENRLSVRDFCIRHQDQFIFITGDSSRDGEGEITVTLADISLDYIFETLNIPHVTFGGNATGAIIAEQIFSSNPILKTDQLNIEALSYNNSILGDANVSAHLDLPDKMIGIGAKIREGEKMVAEADGGVWFGRDSLAFDFKANGVNIGFMQPFMSAFSSDVRGKASGNALLYGNFSDIDMKGTMVAENAEILIDFINAYYTGSDTVYLSPGRIDIPGFKVKDRQGHTAVLEGELTHRYFHDPAFRFMIKDMDNLMVYNTNARINPLWYGKLYASGAGEITGKPGLVTIAADVETSPGSDFTFVLSDQQEAVKSTFLTFSDKKKEEMIIEQLKLQQEKPDEEMPEYLRKYYEKLNANETEAVSDIYKMDFRVSVTDDVKFNLIMDPIAGDKITAYGTGAMNMTYTSLTDELKLYGKYTLDKGTYNFSLQDIILKDFTIKPGSTIAFTGDPYSGMLDLTAAYRVNTSLTELDKSFANDRELNRTSVPVEALLKVSGVLTSPNIDFDIELPTVTEETAQKVKSIISTDDMMSKQVIYLVALNKFYPPEYMSTSSSGGEWASVASSTLSSQLQNMIGQLTDKFTVAPSIRSDKGDFSDIEVDIALSSQLFDNRLLINGNLGYRDASNSSTTFVGDFDLEYLLNKKGNWRLKAYNHFNDQNYYLKSALTTQGIGIVWRKDFGLHRKQEKEKGIKKDEDEEEVKEKPILTIE